MVWENWLVQRRRWIPTVLLFPILYFVGWLIIQPVSILFPSLQKHDLSLLGGKKQPIFFDESTIIGLLSSEEIHEEVQQLKKVDVDLNLAILSKKKLMRYEVYLKFETNK